MTRSIAEPTAPVAPARPVLRRLTEVLASQTPSGAAGTQLGADTDVTGTAAPGIGAAGSESSSLRRIDPAAPAMADRVLRAAIEIVCGRRSVDQLAAVLRPDQLHYLIGLRVAAGRLRPNIQSVHSQQPAPGVLEATGVVVLTTGVRALSARFEMCVVTGGTRWRCTALHLPLTRGDVAAARRLR